MTTIPNEKPCPPSVVKKYRAFRKPACHHGRGCWRCWEKWFEVKKRGRNVVAP